MASSWLLSIDNVNIYSSKITGMNKNSQKNYYMFVDESGVSNLNHSGRYFVLATIIIEKTDFEIIQGYLRLLKRKYFKNDLLNLHATDLYERPYMKYRTLIKPRNRINAFVMDLHTLLLTIPYQSGIYVIDKNIIRNQLSYSPGVRKNPPAGIDLNLPYEKCALRAFFDFAEFLKIGIKTRHLSLVSFSI